MAEPTIRFRYTNWRGETAVRTVVPRVFIYGSSEFHPEPQWLMRAYDVDKEAERDFALKDADFTFEEFSSEATK
jgi:hypothetical protein